MKTAALLILCAGLAAAPRALALEANISTARYPLPANGQVSVENVRGSIQVEGWDRSMVELTVLKTAPDGCGCLDKAIVVASPGKEGWVFRTLYAQETREPVQVDYRLMVPRQVRLEEVRTVQGQIDVRNVEGRVVAETLSGDIRETGVAGHVSAHSLNGNIEVSLESLPASGAGLSFEAVNGNLLLTLPPRPNADLELSTVDGSVVTPYALQVSSRPGDQTRTCRLGRGGILILLRTIRGNIRVTRRNEML